ncbi:hypothetical protein PPERSA_11755 [Pseudocohnilembus persalinus]|uniref:Uncharacterized protein n=1 Tax=Pseudocohnilembus persalinus TaxID=266149 RepID=A0A0V0QGL7_PSEPJ|nr:hypothetical protein PPERSA_11755 [Pseudocohnilembus persalinus]|eukprot:KRX01308.1 hypothetical protein PPERSA_11755 [Pseudocohnilembus persalinus]
MNLDLQNKPQSNSQEVNKSSFLSTNNRSGSLFNFMGQSENDLHLKRLQEQENLIQEEFLHINQFQKIIKNDTFMVISITQNHSTNQEQENQEINISLGQIEFIVTDDIINNLPYFLAKNQNDSQEKQKEKQLYNILQEIYYPSKQSQAILKEYYETKFKNLPIFLDSFKKISFEIDQIRLLFPDQSQKQSNINSFLNFQYDDILSKEKADSFSKLIEENQCNEIYNNISTENNKSDLDNGYKKKYQIPNSNQDIEIKNQNFQKEDENQENQQNINDQTQYINKPQYDGYKSINLENWKENKYNLGKNPSQKYESDLNDKQMPQMKKNFSEQKHTLKFKKDWKNQNNFYQNSKQPYFAKQEQQQQLHDQKIKESTYNYYYAMFYNSVFVIQNQPKIYDFTQIHFDLNINQLQVNMYERQTGVKNFTGSSLKIENIQQDLKLNKNMVQRDSFSYSSPKSNKNNDNYVNYQQQEQEGINFYSSVKENYNIKNKTHSEVFIDNTKFENINFQKTESEKNKVIKQNNKSSEDKVEEQDKCKSENYQGSQKINDIYQFDNQFDMNNLENNQNQVYLVIDLGQSLDNKQIYLNLNEQKISCVKINRDLSIICSFEHLKNQQYIIVHSNLRVINLLDRNFTLQLYNKSQSDSQCNLNLNSNRDSQQNNFSQKEDFSNKNISTEKDRQPKDIDLFLEKTIKKNKYIYLPIQAQKLGYVRLKQSQKKIQEFEKLLNENDQESILDQIKYSNYQKLRKLFGRNIPLLFNIFNFDNKQFEYVVLQQKIRNTKQLKKNSNSIQFIDLNLTYALKISNANPIPLQVNFHQEMQEGHFFGCKPLETEQILLDNNQNNYQNSNIFQNIKNKQKLDDDFQQECAINNQNDQLFQNLQDDQKSVFTNYSDDSRSLNSHYNNQNQAYQKQVKIEMDPGQNFTNCFCNIYNPFTISLNIGQSQENNYQFLNNNNINNENNDSNLTSQKLSILDQEQTEDFYKYYYKLRDKKLNINPFQKKFKTHKIFQLYNNKTNQQQNINLEIQYENGQIRLLIYCQYWFLNETEQIIKLGIQENGFLYPHLSLYNNDLLKQFNNNLEMKIDIFKDIEQKYASVNSLHFSYQDQNNLIHNKGQNIQYFSGGSNSKKYFNFQIENQQEYKHQIPNSEQNLINYSDIYNKKKTMKKDNQDLSQSLHNFYKQDKNKFKVNSQIQDKEEEYDDFVDEEFLTMKLNLKDPNNFLVYSEEFGGKQGMNDENNQLVDNYSIKPMELFYPDDQIASDNLRAEIQFKPVEGGYIWSCSFDLNQTGSYNVRLIQKNKEKLNNNQNQPPTYDKFSLYKVFISKYSNIKVVFIEEQSQSPPYLIQNNLKQNIKIFQKFWQNRQI